MTLELTLTLVLALLFSAGRAHAQANTLLDPGVGPQPTTGFRVSVVTAPITASFTFSPTNGAWPLTVQFVDTTQGGPASWAWDFGDGGTATSQNPIHTFNAPAQTWTIQLTATGPGGSSMASHTLTTSNAIPIDIPLFSSVSPGGGSKHIRSNGRYSTFITHVVGGNNDAQVVCYTDSGLTNSLTLTNVLFFIGLQLDHTVKSNTLVLCGADPFGGNGSVFEYEFGNQSPLPTSITLTTNFHNGPGSTEANTTLLSNGGVACMLTESLNYSNQAFAVSYRRPTGVWTNYGVVIVETNNVVPSTPFPSAFCSAEMPGDNTLWTFQTRDGQGWMLAGVWSFNSTDLLVSKGFQVANNNTTNSVLIWGYQAPYGEFPRCEALADHATNRVLVTYFSEKGYSGAPSVRVGTEVVMGMTADTNHYLFCLSTNTTHRQFPATLCQSNSVVNFGYAYCTSANAEPMDNQAIPWTLQSIPNGQASVAPTSPFLDFAANTGVAGTLYRQDALDFVAKTASGGVWHLLRLTQ